MRDTKTALSYWFPLIEAAGLPVPKTIIIDMPDDAVGDICSAFDGEDGPGGMPAFVEKIAKAAEQVGYPFFLRTDYTSGKHGWDRNCFVPNREAIASCVFGIAEYSEMVDIMGLPWKTWAVREMLPTIPYGVCPRFGNMPICKEFRFFVQDGEVECYHPYWPDEALRQGGAPTDLDFDGLCDAPDLDALMDIARRTGASVGGYWSVDILETQKGWFVTDMAEGERSYHWPGCQVKQK